MDQQQLFIKMAIAGWDLQIARADKLFTAFDDEGLLKEVAPGKNRIIYLLGHLVAYHDALIESIGMGTRNYQHLDDAFIKNADKAGFEMPDAPYLRAAWIDVHNKLSTAFNAMDTAEWFKKHNLVSDEDFANEPMRNRLNMLMGRTAHVAYHLGQMKLV